MKHQALASILITYVESTPTVVTSDYDGQPAEVRKCGFRPLNRRLDGLAPVGVMADIRPGIESADLCYAVTNVALWGAENGDIRNTQA
jgi:hypothetical protein